MSEESRRPKRKDGSGGSGDDDTQTQTPAKRQRVSRACDQCRAAREKCDGIDPCFACASQNRQCSYNTNPKKRGIQPGYIRTLELALAWVFETIPGSEEALGNLLTHESGQGKLLLLGKDTKDSQRLHKRWRRSVINKEIDRLLSRDEGGTHGTSRLSPPDTKYVSDEEPAKDDQIKVVSTQTPSSFNSDMILDSFGFYRIQRAGHGHTTTASQSRDVSKAQVVEYNLKLPSNHWHLLDVYFAYTHCWFPMAEKHDLLKASYAYPENGLRLSPAVAGNGLHAELWAALAVASYQERSSSRGSVKEQERTSMCPQDIYRTARNMVPSEDGRHEIGHVKALLLLALVNIGRKSFNIAWMLVGHAVRIALELGVDRDALLEGTYSRTKHVYFGCFVLDTIISTQLSRIPHLKTENVENFSLLNEDGLEEWQSWSGCTGFGSYGPSLSRSPVHSLSTFNQLFKIHKIFNRMSFLVDTPFRANDLVASLRQSINSQASTASFVLTGQAPDSAIPPAFLLRLLYLTSVTALQASSLESTASSILDLIEIFISIYGLCGAPPLFLSCLCIASRWNPPETLTQDTTDRWKSVESSLASVWTSPDEANGANALPTAKLRPHPLSLATNQTSSTAIGAFSSHPSSQIDPMLQQQALLTPISSMERPQQLQSRTHLSPTSVRQNPSLDQGAPLPDTARSPPSPQTRVMLDYYDLLLDDFGSVDSADRIDADPQFMQNLGFAPGSDLSDVLGADFAVYGGWHGISSGS